MATTSAPIAEDFPVVWTSPGDERLTWYFDNEHTPDVATPLGFDLYFGPFLDGFGWARAAFHNYYVYCWFVDMQFEETATAPDIEQLASSGQYFWSNIVPEVESYTQRFLSTDFDKYSDDQLAEEIALLPALRTRMGRLHTLALLPHGAGMRLVINTYKDLVDDDELAAVKLMQGFGSKSVEAGRALWALSRMAATIPSVRQRVSAAERHNGIECLAALRTDATASGFVSAFDAFLNDFGWRTDLFELAQPTWAEDPAIPFCQMRALLEMEDYDPDVEQRRLAREREDARREALRTLSPADRQRLQDVLDMARHVVSLQEDHNFYIDQRCAFAPRRLILAAGRRLAGQRQLAESGDVFYLSGLELIAALRGELSGADALAGRAKTEMQKWSKVQPPAWLGAPPVDDGTAQAPVVEGGPKELTGNGASAGVARGPARVLQSLAEADKFQPGDVLVARTTMPAWTPLFAPAAAIITETGGVLSHAAVTAREYGTPAVLNVAEATRKIRDGQLIEVDGTQGIVRILS